MKKIEFTPECLQKLGIATLAMVCILSIVLVLCTGAPSMCKQPKWLVLNYMDGGETLVQADKINMVVALKPVNQETGEFVKGAKPATRIAVGQQNFVVVKEKVSTVKKKLCLD